MTMSDLAEDTMHFSDQNLVTASFDKVVSEQSDAVFAVGEDEVRVLPGIRVGRGRDDPLEGVVGKTRRSDPVGVSGIDNNRAQRSTGLDSRC